MKYSCLRVSCEIQKEEGRNTTPLKTPSWTAEVIFTAEVRPKCY